MDDILARLRSYEPLWGAWRISRTLYQGTNSAVFELFRMRGDKKLFSALKVISIRTTDPDERASLLAKALDEIERMEFLARHRGMVAIFDDDIREVEAESGASLGCDVLIRMEYLTCFQNIMREGDVLSEAEIIRLGQDVCDARIFAHEHSFIHRDIKPENIYRTATGAYKLGDFGNSTRKVSFSDARTITGTTANMAPEVARGESYDHRADIYSLGIVLYQLLSDNFLPFTNEGSSYSERKEAIRHRLSGAPLDPHIRGGRALFQNAWSGAGTSRYEVMPYCLTWENAKVYCESRGGHLATITSRQEEDRIIALLREKGMSAVWIGASNRNVSRGFSWVTDERFSYAPWGVSEPNNMGGNEYYVMMQLRGGEWEWNDSRDDGLRNFEQGTVGFVCEWDG